MIINRLSLELSCYYWCWSSVLGGLIIPADSSSTNLGIGLSVTLKAGVELLRWLWGAILGSVVRAPAAKAGDHGFDSRWLPWVFFSLPAGLHTNVDGMKDLWCSIVQFGCYGHRYEWGEGSCTVRLLST